MKTTLSFAGFSATIKHQGAELASLQDRNQREWIWDANPAFWAKHAPVLFPIVGTLKNNQYVLEDHTYTLSRHGFAREKTFRLLSETDRQAVFVLHEDAESLQHYPFEFTLQITYRLNDNGLNVHYLVGNQSGKTMPFALGAHPAFALPEAFEAYGLLFEADTALAYYPLEQDLLVETPKTLALQQHKLALNQELFAKDALVFKSVESTSVTLLENQKPVLKVDFEGFPSLGLWTKPGAPFLCIEPWIGYADTVNASGQILEKEAIRTLEPGGNFETNFGLSIL